MMGASIDLGRGLAGQLALDGLITGFECLLHLLLEQAGIAAQGMGIHLDFDATAGAQAAVVGEANLFVKADREFQRHGVSPIEVEWA
jgi:hypothetical protein